MDYAEFGRSLKKKHPGKYDDLSDEELGRRRVARSKSTDIFPEYTASDGGTLIGTIFEKWKYKSKRELIVEKQATVKADLDYQDTLKHHKNAEKVQEATQEVTLANLELNKKLIKEASFLGVSVPALDLMAIDKHKAKLEWESWQQKVEAAIRYRQITMADAMHLKNLWSELLHQRFILEHSDNDPKWIADQLIPVNKMLAAVETKFNGLWGQDIPEGVRPGLPAGDIDSDD